MYTIIPCVHIIYIGIYVFDVQQIIVRINANNAKIFSSLKL